MNIFTALNTLFLLFAPVNVEEVEIQPTGFRIQVYPYGGYYSYPPCPPGYTYRYGYCYRPGIQFYYGPHYYGRYYDRRYYRRHRRHRQHRHHRRHDSHQRGRRGRR